MNETDRRAKKKAYDATRYAADPGGFRLRNTASYRKNRTERLARLALDRKENPSKYEAARLRLATKLREKKYGLSPDEQVALLEFQRSSCAICKTSLSLHDGCAHLDHDHDTGGVRGFLCGNCNRMLGCAGDSPSRLRAAAAYLDRRQPKLRLVR